MHIRLKFSMLALVAAGCLAFLGIVQASPTAKAQAEIAGLIETLGKTQCEFQRNGSWYDAVKAKAHLQRKYDYLLKRDLVDSAEQFIERAGSQSSMSGRAYQVRCPGQPAQPAAAWFNVQLLRLRSAAATGAHQ